MVDDARQIEPELLQRLGSLVVVSGRVEGLIGDLFATLMRGDRGPLYLVTERVAVSTLMEWVRTLLAIRSAPPAITQEISEILDAAKAFQGERNALVHGQWGTDKSEPGTVMVATIDLQRSEVIVDRLVTAADLDELIAEALAVEQRLLKLLARLVPRTPGN